MTSGGFPPTKREELASFCAQKARTKMCSDAEAEINIPAFGNDRGAASGISPMDNPRPPLDIYMDSLAHRHAGKNHESGRDEPRLLPEDT